MKYAFAGDRQISVDILSFLIEKGYPPLALLVPEGGSASHTEQLIRTANLKETHVFKGKISNNEDVLIKLKSLDLDYIIGIHYPYIVPGNILSIPKVGFLNLHPSFLPYNKGWNTPSWAILNKQPYGATLHFMAEKLDSGDIIHQKQVNILQSDTANSLYQRVLSLEYDVFVEAFDSLLTLNPLHKKQVIEGSSYTKKDLKQVQEIDLNSQLLAKDLIDKLRALTTNNQEEAAYINENGEKIYIQIKLTPERNIKETK